MNSEWKLCEECGSLFLVARSPMASLCSECAAKLYGYPACEHQFENGRCKECGWDGSRSEYLSAMRPTLQSTRKR